MRKVKPAPSPASRKRTHEEQAPGAPLLMLWVVFALLTGAAVLAVLWAFVSCAPRPRNARELDVSFYKAQADEIDRDVTRGVIGEGRGAGWRATRPARRLMAASRAAPDDVRRASPLVTPMDGSGRGCCWCRVIALGLYTQIGAPNLPDDPLEARLKTDPAKMDMAAIMAKLRADGRRQSRTTARGWALLARLYTQLGRVDGAANAYRQEIRLLGPSEERLSALGEDETVLADGHVTPQAQQHFEQAAKLDPKSPRARFYLGLAAEQGGNKTEAVTIWKAIVADGPANAPWLPTVKSRIAAATGEPTAPPFLAASAAPAAGNPAEAGQAKMAAAVAAMPADQQQHDDPRHGRPARPAPEDERRRYRWLAPPRACLPRAPGSRTKPSRRSPTLAAISPPTIAPRSALDELAPRTRARKLTMTRKKRRLTIIGLAPRRVRLRRRHLALRAARHDRVLLRTHRIRAEGTGARYPGCASAASSRPARSSARGRVA